MPIWEHREYISEAMVLSDAAFLRAIQVGTVQVDLTQEPLVYIRILYEGREDEYVLDLRIEQDFNRFVLFTAVVRSGEESGDISPLV